MEDKKPTEGHYLLKQMDISGRAKKTTNVDIQYPSVRSKILLDDINQEITIDEELLGCYYISTRVFQIFDY